MSWLQRLAPALALRDEAGVVGSGSLSEFEPSVGSLSGGALVILTDAFLPLPLASAQTGNRACGSKRHLSFLRSDTHHWDRNRALPFPTLWGGFTAEK